MIINHCLVNLKQNLRKIHKYIYIYIESMRFLKLLFLKDLFGKIGNKAKLPKKKKKESVEVKKLEEENEIVRSYILWTGWRGKKQDRREINRSRQGETQGTFAAWRKFSPRWGAKWRRNLHSKVHAAPPRRAFASSVAFRTFANR